MRDSLLKAAEKRIEQRLQELKEIEARVNGADEEEGRGGGAQVQEPRHMYENMKAKDAAKIFDRLDMRMLVEVVEPMNPRRMSDILGADDAGSCRAAHRRDWPTAPARSAGRRPPAELPKIEGRPQILRRCQAF